MPQTYATLSMHAEDVEQLNDLVKRLTDQLGRKVFATEVFKASLRLLDSESRTHDFPATWAALMGEAGE